jgi:hypothetical protein
VPTITTMHKLPQVNTKQAIVNGLAIFDDSGGLDSVI